MNNFIKNIKKKIDDKKLNEIKKRFQVGKLINRKYAGTITKDIMKKISEHISTTGYGESSLWDMLRLYEKYKNKLNLFEYSKKISWNANKKLVKIEDNSKLEFYLKYGIKENWSETVF